MTSPRINHTITACRLLLLLQQLIQHHSLTYAEINQKFQDHTAVGRPIGSETLTKYIATLRYWGCNIPKATLHNQFRYQLARYPLPVGLTSSQKAVMFQALTSFSKNLSHAIHLKPNSSTTDIVALLTWWIGESPQSNEASPRYIHGKSTETSAMPAPQPTVLGASWHHHWQAWWLGGTWVQVTLHNTPQPLTIEPQGTQTTPHGNIVTGWEVTSGRWISIPLSTILMMHPLPMRSRGRGQRMTATFKLSGRLAKNYRLYPNETEATFENSPQERVIQARVDDTETLLTRLMKYGRHCEVLSPEWARESIRQKIQRLHFPSEFPLDNREAFASPVQ